VVESETSLYGVVVADARKKIFLAVVEEVGVFSRTLSIDASSVTVMRFAVLHV